MDRFTRWRELLQQAPSVEAVNIIMRDYVRQLGPPIGTFSEETRAALSEDPDVQAAAVALLQCELRFEGSEEARALLQEIAYTFAVAAVRVTLLHARNVPLST